jgi:hypothetical protein
VFKFRPRWKLPENNPLVDDRPQLSVPPDCEWRYLHPADFVIALIPLVDPITNQTVSCPGKRRDAIRFRIHDRVVVANRGADCVLSQLPARIFSRAACGFDFG